MGLHLQCRVKFCLVVKWGGAAFHRLISVWVSAGEKACLLGAPVEPLWTSRGVSSASGESLYLYCLRQQTENSCKALGRHVQYHLCLISAVNMGYSFRSQNLTMNHGLTIYSMDLYLVSTFIHVQALSQTGNLLPALLVRPSPNKTGAGVFCKPSRWLGPLFGV